MQTGAIYSDALASLDRLVSKLKPETSSMLKSAVVALYTAGEDKKLRFTTQVCLMHLDFDRRLKTSLLRFYNLEDLRLLLETELYYGFMESYKVRDAELNLWGFELWREGSINVQFRNQEEALIFAKRLEEMAPKRAHLLELSKKQVQEELKKKQSNSFFGKLKSKLFSFSDKPKIDSVVLKVEKSNSVHFDKNGNFLPEYVSPQWEEILLKSGLQPKDLKDREVSKLVMEEAIVFQTKKAAEENPAILVEAGLDRIEDLYEVDEPEEEKIVKPENKVREEQRCELKRRDTSSTVVTEFNDSPHDAPDLPSDVNYRVSLRRQHLIQELIGNKIKLKPVKTCGDGVSIDASSLNKQQRNDLADQIRQRLQKRRQALNRRQSIGED